MRLGPFGNDPWARQGSPVFTGKISTDTADGGGRSRSSKQMRTIFSGCGGFNVPRVKQPSRQDPQSTRCFTVPVQNPWNAEIEKANNWHRRGWQRLPVGTPPSEQWD